MKKKFISSLLVLVLLFNQSALALSKNNYDKVVKAYDTTKAYVLKTYDFTQPVSNDWLVMAMARNDNNLDKSIYKNYYDITAAHVKENKGVISKHKNTEYAKAVLLVTSLGKNAQNVGGYDLTLALSDYDATVKQGINGAIWALIAMDSGKYEFKQNNNAKTQATRQKYLDFILSKQLADGGFALSGTTSDIDITAMSLQALSKYKEQAAVKKVIDESLTFLSKSQTKDGDFKCYNVENLESTVQVIMALCELGIDIEDSRFIKSNRTLIDGLMKYYDNGSFKHVVTEKNKNHLATEQGFYALASIQRAHNKLPSFYQMVK